MIELTAEDKKTLTALNYVAADPGVKGRLVRGGWDMLSLYDTAKYDPLKKNTPVGAVTQRSGGGYLCTLAYKAFVAEGDEMPQKTFTSYGRSEYVGAAVKIADAERRQRVSFGIKEQEEWARGRAEKKERETANQRMAANARRS